MYLLDFSDSSGFISVNSEDYLWTFISTSQNTITMENSVDLFEKLKKYLSIHGITERVCNLWTDFDLKTW